MHKEKSRSFHYLVRGLLAVLAPLGFASGGTVVCNQTYAICTSASCVPIPGNTVKALCDCKVENGASLGNTSCAYRKPKLIAYGLKQIISTYSFTETKINRVMTCSAGTPWANCLNAKCIVDRNAPSKAVCTCQIVASGSYVTYGGNCNTSTCRTQIWSGATKNDFLQGSAFLMQTLKLKKPPYRMCKKALAR
ncbi:hypothetical protein [Coxiella burnetii]|nr:hypothetical protein [Coxiella burnetii]